MMPQRNHGQQPWNKGQSASETASSRVPATNWTAPSATNAVEAASQKADDVATSVGQGMKSMADTIRANAPEQSTFHQAASGMADALERTGRYLEDEGVSGLADDVTHLIRRNPLPVVFAAIGVGFLLAQTMKRR